MSVQDFENFFKTEKEQSSSGLSVVSRRNVRTASSSQDFESALASIRPNYINPDRVPNTPIGKLLDFINRPTYAKNAYIDHVLTDESLILPRVWGGFVEGVKELVSPKQRLSGKDLFEHADPKWFAENKDKAGVFGFIFDVVTDPLNLLSLGVGGAFKGARFVRSGDKLVPLSKSGERLFDVIQSDLVDQGIDGLSALEQAESLIGRAISYVEKTGGYTPKQFDNLVNTTPKNRTHILGFKGTKIKEPQTKLGKVQLVDYGGVKFGPLSVNKGGLEFFDQYVSTHETLKRLADVTGLTKVREVIRSLDFVKDIEKGVDKVISNFNLSFNLDGELKRKLGDKFLEYNKFRNNLEAMGISAYRDLGKYHNDIFVNLAPKQRVKVEEVLADFSNRLNAREVYEVAASKVPDVKPRIFKSPTHFFNTWNKLPKEAKEEAIQKLGQLPPEQAQVLTEVFQSVIENEGKIKYKYVKNPDPNSKFPYIKEQVDSPLDSAFQQVSEILSGIIPPLKQRTLGNSAKLTLPKTPETILDEAIKRGNLGPDEASAVLNLKDFYDQMALFEFQAGLTKRVIAKYSLKEEEAYSKIVRSGPEFANFRRFLRGETLPTGSKFAEYIKGAEKLNEARAAGKNYDVITDAGEIFSLRYLDHMSNMRKSEINHFTEKIFPDGIPNVVEKDLIRLGEKQVFSNNKYLETIWGLAEKSSAIFRFSATIGKTSFAGKQVGGSLFQLAFSQGVEGLRTPAQFRKAFEYVLTGKITEPLVTRRGITVNVSELEAMLNRNAVAKNVAIEGVGRTHKESIVHALNEPMNRISVKEAWAEGPKQGMTKLFQEGARVLNIPQQVEDFFRTSGFLNAVYFGKTEAQAMHLVDKAFFNYTTSLTQAEKFIRSTVMPFYSFQKFASLLILDTFIKTPAIPGQLNRMGEAFSGVWNKVMGGEPLNESERRILPDYLIETPHVFDGFTPDYQAKFRTFNGLTLFDTLNFAETAEDGGLDVLGTFKKGILASMAPFLKVPLELAVGRDFFSDKVLEGVRAGNIGNVDADKLYRNLFRVSGAASGAGGYVLGEIFGDSTQLLGADTLFRKLIRWEEGVNPRTGKREVHINPTFLHVATSVFPNLNDAIKISRDDRTYFDNVLNMTFGVNTVYRDLDQDATSKILRARYERQELLNEYRYLLKAGREESALKALEDLQHFTAQMEAELEPIDFNKIRGSL